MGARRWAAVGLVSAGLAAVSIALGLLYIDAREREGKRIQAQLNGAIAIEAWMDHTRSMNALFAGTAGVAMLGAGVAIAVFELPVFRGERGAGA